MSAQTDIHPSAIIETGARLGQGCRIGPFCHIGPEVELGDRVWVKSHAVVSGRTRIGADGVIFPFAVIGEIPQDTKYQGEATALTIGARVRIREHVTINTGTAGGGGVTRIGDDGLFMAGCHVAHDVQIGNRVILVNSAALAGHCVLGDDVIVGGLAGVHQFVRIGQGAIIGALSFVRNDVVPYGLVQGPRGQLQGINLVGLKRRGVARADIVALRAAFGQLADGEGTFFDRAREIAEHAESDRVRDLVDFILGHPDRSYLTPGAGR